MKRASEKYRYIILYGVLTLILGLSTGATAVAQEYKYEYGGMVGGSMYMGDANPDALLRGWNPAGSLIFRRNFNFRWALKTGLLYGKVSGDTRNTENIFPGHAEVSFNRSVFELGGQMEFNFLPYSDKFAYLNTSRMTPYLLVGLGLTIAPGENKTFVGVNFPLGIGVKYKIVNRINLGLEYKVHRLFGDGFDAPNAEGFNLDNPYKIQSGLFKNKDWYNTLMISVTWDFGPNDRKCTNE
ncbi:MAG: porin family protein [Candidatus Symbiothrix sp.]|jgi:opacity protein-like surface antigen|nr:porin family protein [Candidatus Symbiothrix sp.]